MGITQKKKKCKLVTMLMLNFSYFMVELVIGHLFNSTALVADSFHMLSDVVALLVAYFAVRMSSKKWAKNTYGWARAEVLGALVNSVFLIALCFSIFVESIKKIFKTEELKDPILILIVGSLGLLMNLVGLCIFGDHGHSHNHHHQQEGIPLEGRKSTLTHSNRLTRMVSNVEAGEVDSGTPVSSSRIHDCKGDHSSHFCEKSTDSPQTLKTWEKNTTVKMDVRNSEGELTVKPIRDRNSIQFKSKMDDAKKGGASADQMNLRAVFFHLLADTMGSVVVVVSALVYEFTDWQYKVYIDPCISIFMVTLIAISVCPLLIESSMILLQSVPDHINLDELEKKLLKQIDGVMGIHELHVWRLAGDRIIATAHIKCRTLQEYFDIAEKVKAVFHNEGIHSTTIQPEFSQQSPGVIWTAPADCYLSCSAISTIVDCSGSTCCPPTNCNEQHDHNQQTANQTPTAP